MTTANLIKRIAQKTGYWDYANAQVFTAKDVREADMLDALNDKYEEVLSEYFKENPEYYEREATTSNYATSSTIASISSTTLTIDDANFTNNMEDAIVYNSTQDSYEKIATYTSTTVVELDDTVSDWEAGDTVYVITGVYTFGGNATDIYGYPLYVGVKYNGSSGTPSDDNFTRCTLWGDTQAFRGERGRDRDDVFPESDPIYTLTTITVSGTPTAAVKIRPIPEEYLDDSIYIKYIERPSLLSDDDDEPRLPLTHHKFLSDGAVAEICFGHLDDHEKGAIFEQRFREGRERLLNSMISGDEVRDVTLTSRLNDFRKRNK